MEGSGNFEIGIEATTGIARSSGRQIAPKKDIMKRVTSEEI